MKVISFVYATAMKYFPMGRVCRDQGRGCGRDCMRGRRFSERPFFQIGGFQVTADSMKESIYATKFAVFTAEWRYLVSLNSYLFFNLDASLGAEPVRDVRTTTVS